MVNVGPEIFDGPVSGIGVSDQSRHFAVHIRELGQLGDIFPPRIEDSVFDSRHPTMIQNDCHVRAMSCQIDGYGQLAVKNADVIREPIIGEAGYVIHESFSLPQFISLVCKTRRIPFSFGWPAILSR